jgi:hypothetical protein
MIMMAQELGIFLESSASSLEHIWEKHDRIPLDDLQVTF